MDSTPIQELLNFFQDYFNLCLEQNWPNNATSNTEMRNAFSIAQHIEKCLDSLQKKDLLNEFLYVFNEKQDTNSLIKPSFTNPSRFILKKVLNSNVEIAKLDLSFKVFLELYSEEKLEEVLTDLFVESASTEVLLKNLPHLTKSKVTHFKSVLYLHYAKSCDIQTHLKETLKECDANFFETILLCILNKEVAHQDTSRQIKDGLFNILNMKSNTYKKLWKYLFNVETSILTSICLENTNIFEIISKALFDCSKLLLENMSAEYFYIDLTYSELGAAFRKLCSNNLLKEQFFCLIIDLDSNKEFWMNLL